MRHIKHGRAFRRLRHGNTANTQKEEQPAAAVQQEVKLSGARSTPVVVAAQKVGPAVVGITNKAYVRDFFNRVQLTERGTGSGVIYDKSGLMLPTTTLWKARRKLS